MSISQSARDRLAAESTTAAATHTASFDTNQGTVKIHIESSSSHRPAGYTELPPLLMPSPANIQALSNYVSQKMPGLPHRQRHSGGAGERQL